MNSNTYHNNFFKIEGINGYLGIVPTNLYKIIKGKKRLFRRRKKKENFSK